MSERSRFRFFVLWQSLVVDSYRSFFTHLLKLSGTSVTLVAPRAFRELGGQNITCTPFQSPFSSGSNQLGRSHILNCFSPHVQIAWFSGLRKALQSFRQPTSGDAIFLCIAEPYSITALFAWIMLKLTSGSKVIFITYSAQNIFKTLNPVLALIQKFLFRRSEAILVCGHEQGDVLKRHGYTGPIIYFPLWYDQERFRPIPRQRAEEILGGLAQFDSSPRFGYCGSMTEEKGLHDILNLFKRGLAPKGANLFCVGSGPIASEAAEAGASIQYLGRLSIDQVTAFMNAIDVLIVPSRTCSHWKEQFGRVIVEAMACGAVVIGSDSGEIPFVINDPMRIFKEGDLEDLARITQIWSDIIGTPTMSTEQQSSLLRAKLFTDQACARMFLENLQRCLD